MLTARTAVSTLSAASTALSVIWSTLSSCPFTRSTLPPTLLITGRATLLRSLDERRKALDGSGQAHEQLREREADGEQEDGEGEPPEVPPGECRDEHPRPILVATRRDQAASDDGVAVVENGRLARARRRTPARRARAGSRAPSARRVAGDRRRAVAELRLDALDVDVEPAARRDRRARERLARADDDGVRRGVGAEDVERLGAASAEAAPLAGREPPEAVVPAELAAVLVDDRAVARLEPVPPEERAVVVAGEEARLLALGACARRRARRARPRRASRPCPARRAGTQTRASCFGSSAASM